VASVAMTQWRPTHWTLKVGADRPCDSNHTLYKQSGLICDSVSQYQVPLYTKFVCCVLDSVWGGGACDVSSCTVGCCRIICASDLFGCLCGTSS
jgi:hypothetical protein